MLGEETTALKEAQGFRKMQRLTRGKNNQAAVLFRTATSLFDSVVSLSPDNYMCDIKRNVTGSSIYYTPS